MYRVIDIFFSYIALYLKNRADFSSYKVHHLMYINYLLIYEDHYLVYETSPLIFKKHIIKCIESTLLYIIKIPIWNVEPTLFYLKYVIQYFEPILCYRRCAIIPMHVTSPLIWDSHWKKIIQHVYLLEKI